MTDAGMEEYGQDSPDDWLTSTDYSMASPQKKLTTSTRDWSDMLNDIGNFTDVWPELPSEIPTKDSSLVSLLTPTNGKQFDLSG